MDMKQINTEYQKFQTLKTKVGANITKFESEITALENEKAYYKHLKENPSLASKQGYALATIEAELNRIDTELKDKMKKLQEQKNGLQKFQAELDKVIETVKQDPAIATEMDKILAKRYDRELVKLEEKKEKVIKEQKNMEAVAMANRKSPFMANALKDILRLEADKKKLISDMNSLVSSDPDYTKKVAKYKSDIKVIEKKEENTKKSIVAAVKMEKTDFTNDDLEIAINRMGQHMTILKNGDIQLDDTLKRTFSSYNKQLNITDKQILTNTVAYAKIGVVIENSKSQAVKNVKEKIDKAETEKLQADIEAAKQAERNKIIDEENKRRQSLVPTQKPKWFQFIKRFQQWRSSKKITSMPSIEESLKDKIEAAEKKAEQDVIEANDKIKQEQKNKETNIRDVYKYDVVQQVINDQTKQKWVEAKKTVKEAKENSER